MSQPRIIGWVGNEAIGILDQTLLPKRERWLVIEDVDGLVEAIRSLRVRGAPLIGIAAAMGLAANLRKQARSGSDTEDLVAWLEAASQRVAAARPTAVNLGWAVARLAGSVKAAATGGCDGPALADVARAEAQAIWDEDVEMCSRIGELGAGLISNGPISVMTHCNAGRLATGGIGTALGVVYTAHGQGKVNRVYARETRPLNQGTRLTAWELTASGVPCTVTTDSAAASLIAGGGIESVIVGADRIAANGDVANKIGTYPLAVMARRHDVAFYVAAPVSTFDLTIESGSEIPIEMRNADEIPAASGCEVFNPAFDVTPGELVTAIITNRGIITDVSHEGVRRVLGNDK